MKIESKQAQGSLLTNIESLKSGAMSYQAISYTKIQWEMKRVWYVEMCNIPLEAQAYLILSMLGSKVHISCKFGKLTIFGFWPHIIISDQGTSCEKGARAFLLHQTHSRLS